jgi:5-formyltetrahydrofolate cyclo-ligase
MVEPLPSGQINPREAKRALRATVVSARGALGDMTRAEASRRIVGHVLALPAFKAARGVHCFLSVPEEVDTAALFAACVAANKTTFVPYQIRSERRLGCARWSPGDLLTEGPHGIREPAKRDPPEIQEHFLAAIDLVLVPGAAFDRHGNRLGYGLGYYDGFLKGLAERHGEAGWNGYNCIAQPTSVALAFQVQVVPDIPTEPWDVRVPLIVTEAGMITCS